MFLVYDALALTTEPVTLHCYLRAPLTGGLPTVQRLPPIRNQLQRRWLVVKLASCSLQVSQQLDNVSVHSVVQLLF